MTRKVGLPEFVKSRYDNHFVDEISARTKTSIIRKIPLSRIVPNLLQPRKNFNDLHELSDSIKEKGILEPLLVRPKDGNFEIIAGERRYRAAKIAGLTEVPCIEYDVPDNEALEISIIENIQRKDLDVFEKAYSLKSLSEIYGYTHEDIAKNLGKSRVTISELIKITELPEDIVDMCRDAKIESKSFLLQMVKLKDHEEMIKIVEEYKKNPFSREEVKALRNKIASGNKQSINTSEKTVKPIKFKFISEDKNIRIDFKIKKTDDKNSNIDSILKMLEKLIEDIKIGNIKDLDI